MSLNQIVNPNIDADFKSLKVQGVDVSGGAISTYTPVLDFVDGEMTINDIFYNWSTFKESRNDTKKYIEVYVNISFQGTYAPTSGRTIVTTNLSLPVPSDSTLISGSVTLSQNNQTVSEIFVPTVFDISENNAAMGLQGFFQQTTATCCLIGSFIYSAPL